MTDKGYEVGAGYVPAVGGDGTIVVNYDKVPLTRKQRRKAGIVLKPIWYDRRHDGIGRNDLVDFGDGKPAVKFKRTGVYRAPRATDG